MIPITTMTREQQQIANEDPFDGQYWYEFHHRHGRRDAITELLAYDEASDEMTMATVSTGDGRDTSRPIMANSRIIVLFIRRSLSSPFGGRRGGGFLLSRYQAPTTTTTLTPRNAHGNGDDDDDDEQRRRQATMQQQDEQGAVAAGRRPGRFWTILKNRVARPNMRAVPPQQHLPPPRDAYDL